MGDLKSSVKEPSLNELYQEEMSNIIWKPVDTKRVCLMRDNQILVCVYLSL